MMGRRNINNKKCMRSEIIGAVIMKITVFWNVPSAASIFGVEPEDRNNRCLRSAGKYTPGNVSLYNISIDTFLVSRT
jgi:hypothetical protein